MTAVTIGTTVTTGSLTIFRRTQQD